MLKVKNVTKQFGGVVAIKDVNFEVKQNEIFALVGPNGAGKTTLFNIITGAVTPTKGKVFFKDEEITGLNPVKIVEKGIARTFQNIRLFNSLTVLENVLIGFHNHIEYTFFEAVFRFPRFFKQEKIHKDMAMEILKFLKIDKYAFLNAKALSYGNQRKVEIARALATNPKLLLLDEPTAGVSPIVMDEIFSNILDVRDAGMAVLMVEQNAQQALNIADKGYVLVSGRNEHTGTGHELINDPEVRKKFLGG